MGIQGSRTAVEDVPRPEHLAQASPEEILRQLDRIVASVHFRNSKRYPAFLRFIVEQTLLGHMDSLKERTLGIEVFGRVADYDTNLDPVVRVTAGEIRKRIAQYYQMLEHECELRFDLPLGSYIPHFLPPHSFGHSGMARRDETFPHASPEQPATTALTPSLEIPAHVSPALPGSQDPTLPHVALTKLITSVPPPSKRKTKWSHFTSGLVLWQAITGTFGLLTACVLISVLLLSTRKEEAGLSFIWGPILRSKQPATIVLGVHSFDINGNDLSPLSYARLPLGQQTALASMIRSDMVPVTDVVSYSQLVGLLVRKGASFRTQSSGETTIDEFRHGPLILVGAFDNMWTMRLTAPLRFRFVAKSESLHEIQDAEHPAAHWSFDNAQSALSTSRDYAIVARFFDPQLEQHVLVVAGIGKSGTEAAAEFVTDKRSLQTWFEFAPSEHQDNVEIVLSTDLVEGKHGPPHVVASYRW